MTDREEVRAAAREAAREVLIETFSHFGVDLNDQESVNKFRCDLIHSRRVRRFMDSTKSRAWMVFVGIVVISASMALWEGILALVKGLK